MTRVTKNVISNILVLVALLGTIGAKGQTTYTWNQTGLFWATGSSWTPTRITPASDDILVINGGGLVFIFSVPTETIGRLSISGGTNAFLFANGGTQTLTIGNGTGADLVVANGSSLTVFNSLENIVLATNASADIAGTLNNTSNFDLSNVGTIATVSGNFTNSGTITGSTISKLIFPSGGTYTHALNGGTIPTSSWNANSTCIVTGVSNTVPGGLGQNFGNFTWNSNQGNNSISLATNMNIQGNFTVSNTGNGNLRLTNNGTSRTLSIGGNYIQTAGIFQLNNGTGSGTATVQGNFSLSGGICTLVSGTSNSTFNVIGNVNITNGTLLMTENNNTIGTLNVGGDFSFTGGTITENSNGGGALNFTGTSAYTGGGTVSNNIDFTVNNAATLVLGTGSLSSSSNQSTFTLNSGGMLQLNINSLAIFGRIAVGGASILNGTLAPNFGSFVPIAGNTFDLITNGGSGNSGNPTLSITPASISGTYTNTTGVLSLTDVLPINLLSFTGKRVDKTIELHWQTATEQNNDYMAVERAADGIRFSEIGRVNGMGTTNHLQNYSFLDESPLRGTNYYRLRQVDFDGQMEYHRVITVDFLDPTGQSVKVYPNPAQEQLQVSWETGQSGTMLQLFNARGQMMAAYTVSENQTTFEVPLQQLSAGIYFLKWLQGDRLETVRFIKE